MRITRKVGIQLIIFAVVSVLAFTLGLAWIVFDRRRQGWHDKIAGTLVINTPNAGGPGFLRRMFKIEPRS